MTNITLQELTNNFQIDEGLSLSVFVLDDNLVLSLVRLLGVLHPIISSVSGYVDVLLWQTNAIEKPFGLGAGISIIGNRHEKWFSSICHEVLIHSLDLRNSCSNKYFTKKQVNK